MNREEYFSQLERKNGYCECDNLRELFEKIKRTEELEANCDFYKRNIDLENPRKEDLQIIIKYRDEFLNLRSAAREYHKFLGKCVKDNKVVLFLHSLEDLTARKISVLERNSLLRKEKDAIFSYHCASCGQQIDVGASQHAD